MKKVLVTISGMPRSGKDTLINAILKSLAKHTDILPDDLWHGSVIDPFKAMFETIRQFIPVNVVIDDEKNLTRHARQFLADCKNSADENLDFTVEYAKHAWEYHDIVIFQVREAHNIQKLHKAFANGGMFGIGKPDEGRVFLPVWVDRDRPIEDHKDWSTNDINLRHDKNINFEYVIKSDLSALDAYAAIIAKRIYREYKSEVRSDVDQVEQSRSQQLAEPPIRSDRP